MDTKEVTMRVENCIMVMVVVRGSSWIGRVVECLRVL